MLRDVSGTLDNPDSLHKFRRCNPSCAVTKVTFHPRTESPERRPNPLASRATVGKAEAT